MTETELAIAEQFYSVQGEGPYAGAPSVFLRLAHCNLSCGVSDSDLPASDAPQEMYERRQADDATWVCDTLSVWREASFTVTPDELIEQWSTNGWAEKLQNGAHVVLTGGEPTLPGSQQSFLALYGSWLVRYRGPLFVEVETNGTIRPSQEFVRKVDQWNVSLKLSNSGMPESRRINPEAIEFYCGRDDADFKFVVGREEDVDEILGLVDEYGVPREQVMLMPAGSSQEQLAGTYPTVAELCKEHGFRFSPRLHVDIWNQATGV